MMVYLASTLIEAKAHSAQIQGKCVLGIRGSLQILGDALFGTHDLSSLCDRQKTGA